MTPLGELTAPEVAVTDAVATGAYASTVAVRHFLYPLSSTMRRGQLFDDGRGNVYPLSVAGFLDCYAGGTPAEWPVTKQADEIRRDDFIWVNFGSPVDAVIALGYARGPTQWSERFNRFAVIIDWDAKLTHRLQEKPIPTAAHKQRSVTAVQELNPHARSVIEKWMVGQFPTSKPRTLPKTNYKTVPVEQRQGQPEFRQALMTAYRNQCVVTGCAIRDVLHAAHIVPPRSGADHHLGNGLLLRSDIHDLFDRGLIAIDKDCRVWVHPAIREREYRMFHRIELPLVVKYANKTALKRHRDLHNVDTTI